MELTSRQGELLERAVTALERMAEDPVIQVETGPPVCPHCEKMNPSVRVQEAESSGELGEFVIQAHCLHCNKVFYALPYQWATARDIDQARNLMNEKLEMAGYGNNGGTNPGT